MTDKPSVLIVEDEAIIAEDLRHRLNKLGYHVAGSVASGPDAIAMTESWRPDVVLMDILLKGKMDGIQAAKIIKQKFGRPIVYITSHADDNTVNSATATEPLGYLLKPIDDRELRITLQMAIYRHYAERKIRQLEKWMATTLRSVGDGLIATDLDGRVSYMNRSAEELTGWSVSEAIGMSLETIFPLTDKDGNPIHNLVFRTLQEGGIHLERRTMMQKRDGQLIYVDDSASPILDEEENVTGIVIVFRDGTANIAAEDNARASESQIRQIIDLVPAYIYAKDTDDRFVLANRMTAEAFGRKPEELEGKTVSDLNTEKSDFSNYFKVDLDVVASQQMKHIPEEKVAEYGNRVFHSTRIPFTLAHHGQPAMLGVAVDITNLKKAEEERDELLKSEVRARSVAEDALKAKDYFLAALSHELRTPLTPCMLLLSKMRMDRTLPPRYRDDLDLIYNQLRQETHLIDDLLDVSRIGANRMVLRREIIDLNKVIEEAAHGCAGKEDITLSIRMEAQQHFIEADFSRMLQVFANVIGNAYKFTSSGGEITLRVHNSKEGAINIDVTDTGRGIDAELLPKLFTAFEQGAPNVARQFGGLGLGLAISKSIVQMHGGTISAASAGQGKGTTIHIELSAVPSPSENVPFEGREISDNTRSLRILLVEDDAATGRVLTRILADMGHQVKLAQSVEAGRQAADSEKFDLLISDIGLPDGTGMDVMRHVRDTCGIPGIAVSGFGQAADIQRSREAGFFTHLTKPIDVDQLLELVGTTAKAIPAVIKEDIDNN